MNQGNPVIGDPVIPRVTFGQLQGCSTARAQNEAVNSILKTLPVGNMTNVPFQRLVALDLLPPPSSRFNCVFEGKSITNCRALPY